jgi:hypothetical protein
LLEEKRNNLAKAIPAAAAAEGPPVPTLSWDFQPLSFGQYGAPGEVTSLKFLEKVCIRIADSVYCSPSDTLRRFFRVISYRIWSEQAHAVLVRLPSTFAYPLPSMPS